MFVNVVCFRSMTINSDWIRGVMSRDTRCVVLCVSILLCGCYRMVMLMEGSSNVKATAGGPSM